jgi:hypothetical protein
LNQLNEIVEKILTKKMKNTLIIAAFSLLTMTFSAFAQEEKPKQIKKLPKKKLNSKTPFVT